MVIDAIASAHQAIDMTASHHEQQSHQGSLVTISCFFLQPRWAAM